MSASGSHEGAEGGCLAAMLHREREEDRAWKRIHAGPPYAHPPPIRPIQKITPVMEKLRGTVQSRIILSFNKHRNEQEV